MPLPKGLKLDPPFNAKPKVFDSARTVHLETTESGYPLIKSEGRTLWPSKAQEIIDFLREAPHSFICCFQGEFDSFLKFLTQDQLVELSLTGTVQMGPTTIHYYMGALRIQTGMDNCYIWNLSNFVKPDLDIYDYDDLGSLFLFEMGKVGIPPYTLATPASLSRRMFEAYEEVRRELGAAHRLPRKMLNTFYDASHGPRMESAGLGTQPLWHYDKYHSHLELLKECKSLIGASRREGHEYSPAADYGAYFISTFIPAVFKFNPLPVKQRRLGQTYYPSNAIKGWYSKPYLDLLRLLHIPFKVYSSSEIFCEEGCPYQQWIDSVESIIEHGSNLIHLKSLYASIIGSSRATYVTLNMGTGELEQRARSSFNPILYSHIMAQQAVGIWLVAYENEEDVEALRVDAVSSNRPLKKLSFGLQLKVAGDSTFLTPHYKSYPGFDFWREMIEEDTRRRGVEIYYSFNTPLKLATYDPKLLSRKIHTQKRILPIYGCRTGPPIKAVGMLLDDWFPSKPANEPAKVELNTSILDYVLAKEGRVMQ